MYNFATDNYALALTLKEIFEYIDWSKHPKEKRAAEDLIYSYERQIIPFLTADIASKVAKRRIFKSKKGDGWYETLKKSKSSKVLPKLNVIDEVNNNNNS